MQNFLGGRQTECIMGDTKIVIRIGFLLQLKYVISIPFMRFCY